MAPTATKPEDAEATETTEDGKAPQTVSVPSRVKVDVWRKLRYLALKRSMQSGTNVTMSQTVGEILEKYAEQLPEPPADLVEG